MELEENIFFVPKNTPEEYQNVFSIALQQANKDEISSLTKEDIRFVYGNSKLNTFQTRPSIPYALLGKRVYLIVKSKDTEVNSLWSGLSKDAQIGILIHEYCHILDYRKMSLGKMLVFGLRYLVSKNFRKDVEHRVDSIAIQKSEKYNHTWKNEQPKIHINEFSKKYWENVRNLYIRHGNYDKK